MRICLLAFAIALAPTLLIADEIRKYFVRRRMARHEALGNEPSRGAGLSASRTAVEGEVA